MAMALVAIVRVAMVVTIKNGNCNVGNGNVGNGNDSNCNAGNGEICNDGVDRACLLKNVERCGLKGPAMGSYITHRPLVHQLLPDSISCVRQLCVIKIQIQIQIQIQKQTQNTSHPGLNCTSAAPQVHIQNTNYKYKHKYIMRRAVVHQLVVESLSHVCGRCVSSYTMAM